MLLPTGQEDSSVQGASMAFVAGGEGFIGAKKVFSFTVSDENSEIEILEKFQCDEGGVQAPVCKYRYRDC